MPVILKFTPPNGVHFCPPCFYVFFLVQEFFLLAFFCVCALLHAWMLCELVYEIMPTCNDKLNVSSLLEGRDKHITVTLNFQLHAGSGEHPPAAKQLRIGDVSTLGAVKTFVW